MEHEHTTNHTPHTPHTQLERNKEQTIKKIVNFFVENESTFYSCIEELDSYNGYLGDSRYYEMYLLNEFYQGVDPIEILQRAFFGHDDDNWVTDSYGNKTYGAFNPNREYFTFNGYGNLISSNYKDYSNYLDDYSILAMLEYRQHIDTIEGNQELNELFNELEETEIQQ